MELGVQPEQIIRLLFLASLVSFVLILIAGITNRVVIFVDRVDFIWSTLLTLIPVATVGVAMFLAPEDVEGHNPFTDDAIGITISTLGSLGTMFALYKCFQYSITANGLVVGAFIGIFKVIASFILVCCILGLIGQALGKKERGTSIAGIAWLAIFTAAFAWLLTRMINGEAVAARRQELLHDHIDNIKRGYKDDI